MTILTLVSTAAEDSKAAHFYMRKIAVRGPLLNGIVNDAETRENAGSATWSLKIPRSRDREIRSFGAAATAPS